MSESEKLIEQKITKRITINAGETGKASITIPKNRKCYLKGYGYSWYTANTYQLFAGNTAFPSRTDQEGSPSIPIIYGQPFEVNSGNTIHLTIINGDTVAHTYDVVFYILSNELLNETSTGGELVLATGGASGSVGSSVYITDSTGTSIVDVVNDGTRNRLCVDTELTVSNVTIDNIKVFSTDGTVANAKYGLVDNTNHLLTKEQPTARSVTHTKVSVGTSSTSVLAASPTRKAALFVNDSDETMYLKIGAAAVMNEGIRINANGGNLLITFKEGTLATEEVFAICASGNKNILITEWT